ncbi:MAG TPA: hypothetical protein VM120_12415 [Bryobacteraceae bacterium]|nr:hypothetical protein [Bryobacteraceae bacterium]
MKGGATVYIAQQSYREIVTENLIPRSAVANDMMLKETGIKVAPNGNAADRLDVVAKNARDGGSVLGEKDARVAGEAKSLGAEIWSPDKAYRNNGTGVAKTLGVKVAPECSLPIKHEAPADYRVGRELMKLPPVEIALNGTVTNRNPPGGGGSGIPPGTIKGGPAVSMPPNPRAEAIGGGVVLLFEGINLVFNKINDHIQKKKIEEALAKEQNLIAKARAAKPNQGILLLFTMRYTQPLPDSVIKPGAEFLYLRWGQGATQDQARMEALKEGAIGPGLLKDQSLTTQEAWIAPIQKGGVTEIQTPFPIVAIGKFWMPKERKAEFQNVKFDWIEGFDDNWQTSREVPGNLEPEFMILRPPAEVHWHNRNGKQPVRVPLVQRDTANGNKITVVDLDPYSLGSAAAAMIFPLNEDAKVTFESTQATAHGGLLRYPNLSMMRWTRAGNIHLLRFT